MWREFTLCSVLDKRVALSSFFSDSTLEIENRNYHVQFFGYMAEALSLAWQCWNDLLRKFFKELHNIRPRRKATVSIPNDEGWVAAH